MRKGVGDVKEGGGGNTSKVWEKDFNKGSICPKSSAFP